MKTIVAGLLATCGTVAVLLAWGQRPFARAAFEYGTFRPYKGSIEAWPVPILATENGRYLLVAPGKHGADDLVRGLDRKVVTLEGSLIHRGRHQMLELLPSSLQVMHDSPDALIPRSQGKVCLTGEVVDTKCYLGVMNPGEGKVHRACAARCISGGAPAALAVDDRLLVLTGLGDLPIHREIVPYAGERVTVTGELIQAGGLEVLRVTPKDFRRE